MICGKARMIGLLLLVLAVLAAPACRPAATPSPTPAATPLAPAPSAPTPTIIATPAPPPQPEGELRLGWTTLGSEVLDPTLTAVSGIKLHGVLLYDFLVGATPEGQLSARDGLAEKWDIEHSATKSVYTFNLRKGVKFHNGDELTAEDVKFTLQYYMRERSLSSGVSFLKRTIDKVEVVDPYKVVIHTKGQSVLLLYYLSPLIFAEGFVLPKRYIEEKGEEYFNRNPVGSGPYRFKDQVVGSYITFEAVANHWRIGMPKFRKITLFQAPEESTRLAMLKTGAVDIIDISRERSAEVVGAGAKLFSKPGGDVAMLWFGNQFQPDTYLADKRVRLALNLAIDREAIVKALLRGQGTVVGHGYYGSWSLGYKPLPLYPYDPDQAKKLLTEAFPGGVELTYNTFPRPGIAEIQLVNEAIASMWIKVGVKVKLVPMVDYSVHRPKQVAGQVPNTVITFSTSNQAIWLAGWRFLFHSKGPAPIAKIPELDRKIEEAEAELNTERLAERQRDIAQYARENHLDGALFELTTLYAAVPKKVPQWDMGKLFWDINLLDIVRRK